VGDVRRGVGTVFLVSLVAAMGCAQGSKTEGSGVGGGGGEGGSTTVTNPETTTSEGGATSTSQAGGGAGGTTASGGQGGSTGGQGGTGGQGAGPGCGNGVLEAGEACDGPTGKICADLGYTGGAVGCTAACTYDLKECSGCGDGMIEQAVGEDCDFDAQGDPLVAATCASLGYPLSGANPGCLPNCKFDIRVCQCGNGTLDEMEPCDGANLGGKTCVTEGYGSGQLACSPACVLDESGCNPCQNGVIDPGEQCDGANLGGHTCKTEGFGSGLLFCNPACTLNTAACSLCGNGVINAGETCDDGNTVAGDGCDATCHSEIVACDPDGVYTIQGAPVAYTCCFGLVSVNVSSFLFSANGASIGSSPSNPVTMSGAATTCPVGSFNNIGTIPGGCAETYHLTGSFTSANTWTGTYEVQFSGPDCSCFGGAGTPCVNQLFPISATR